MYLCLHVSALALSNVHTKNYKSTHARTHARACAHTNTYKTHKHSTTQHTQVRLEPLRTLSFDVTLEHDGDVCYLAHCFPYTYSDLQQTLQELQLAEVRERQLREGGGRRPEGGGVGAGRDHVDNAGFAGSSTDVRTDLTASGSHGSIEDVPETVPVQPNPPVSGAPTTPGPGPRRAVAVQQTASTHRPAGSCASVEEQGPARAQQEHLRSARASGYAGVEEQLMLRREVLCRTIAGNRCEMLTITEPPGARAHLGSQLDAPALQRLGPVVPLARRIGIVLTARVHPGESNSSWVMDGVLRFLTSDDPEAIRLRAHFVFRIVPMLNPDGVVNGNYRCGLAGHDLNRRYEDASASLHPTIHALKKMVKAFKRLHTVGLYVDLHGHSSKSNAFVYGCEAKMWREWFAAYTQGPPPLYSELVFPTLLEHRCPLFSMVDSSFKLRKSKLGTGRSFMWHDGIPHTFTLECSFGGASTGPHGGRHFGIQDLRNIGRHLCQTVWDMYGHDSEATFQRILASGPARAQALEAQRRPRGAQADEHGGSCEGTLESEGSGEESSEDETLVDPVRLFPLALSERVKIASDNLSQGLQASGKGKPWQSWLKNQAPTNPNRMSGAVDSFRNALLRERANASAAGALRPGGQAAEVGGGGGGGGGVGKDLSVAEYRERLRKWSSKGGKREDDGGEKGAMREAGGSKGGRAQQLQATAGARRPKTMGGAASEALSALSHSAREEAATEVVRSLKIATQYATLGADAMSQVISSSMCICTQSLVICTHAYIHLYALIIDASTYMHML